MKNIKDSIKLTCSQVNEFLKSEEGNYGNWILKFTFLVGVIVIAGLFIQNVLPIIGLFSLLLIYVFCNYYIGAKPSPTQVQGASQNEYYIISDLMCRTIQDIASQTSLQKPSSIIDIQPVNSPCIVYFKERIAFRFSILNSGTSILDNIEKRNLINARLNNLIKNGFPNIPSNFQCVVLSIDPDCYHLNQTELIAYVVRNSDDQAFVKEHYHALAMQKKHLQKQTVDQDF